MSDGGPSRRDLLRLRFGAEEPVAPAPAAVARYDRPSSAPGVALLRPPGAVAESEFLTRCTRCGDCQRACPHDAITVASPRARAAAGTPIIDPSASPCRMCEDLPCAAACGTGALVATLAAPLGTAHVQRLDCLNALGSPCSACAEQCPVEGALVVRDGVPRVTEALCTGCGVCQYVCPAPSKAIFVLPARQRPSAAPVGAP